MAKQSISVGSSANDGTGDTLRAAGQKVNSNFNELYSGHLSAVSVVSTATVDSTYSVYVLGSSAVATIPNVSYIQGVIKHFLYKSSNSGTGTINLTGNTGFTLITMSPGSTCSIIYDGTDWQVLNTYGTVTVS